VLRELDALASPRIASPPGPELAGEVSKRSEILGSRQGGSQGEGGNEPLPSGPAECMPEQLLLNCRAMRKHDLAAARANEAFHDAIDSGTYAAGAPHLVHPSLVVLHRRLIEDTILEARRHAAEPTVLELGAGDGSATRPMLELGARVTAIDVSQRMLERLGRSCADFGDRLELECALAQEVVARRTRRFDIVVASSFLHHVPDYIALISDAVGLMEPRGQFFSFQDPMRYDGLGRFGSAFSRVAYLSWRVRRGDVLAGLLRRLRRSRGVYLADSVHDNTEYHVTRNGVDQHAIAAHLQRMGFECRVVRYFNTQSAAFQRLGEALGVENTFAVLARRTG